VHISSLALLKMLKHGRAGVPMEVMGLMLGEFVDEYTVSGVRGRVCSYKPRGDS
jgi:26S proteasome regulatory subunit N11